MPRAKVKKITKGVSHECQVLSTEYHQHCPLTRYECDCPCHIPRDQTVKRRPHSYPRKDWESHKPRGWSRRRELG